MFKSSIKKIIFVSGGNISNAVVGFIFLAIVAKYLPLDDFGKYALLTSLLLVFVKLIDFGSNSVYVTKYITDNEETFTENFHSLKILLFAVVAPIALLVINKFFPNDLLLLIIFLVGLIAYTINFTCYAHFQKVEKYTQLILLNSLPALVKIFFAVLIFLGAVKINYVLAFGLFSFSILADIVLIPFLPSEAKTIKFNFNFIWLFIKKGIPSGFSQLVQEGWPALNNTITKLVRNYNDVGSFSLASKISNIFSLISLSVFTVLLPKNAKLKGQKKAYDIKETIVIALAIILLAFIAIAVSGVFIKFVFGTKFEGSLRVLDILIFSSAFSAIHTFAENYFLVENKNRFILYTNVGKLLAFGLTIVIFSKSLGMEGVAYSNLIASIVALVITVV